MQKRMVSFSDPQYDYLVEEAARLGIPVSELVRRIIDKWRELNDAKEADEGDEAPSDEAQGDNSRG
jgi:hypothetical protein